MKFRVLGAGLAATVCLLAPQQAQALTVLTSYQPFKIFQNSANNVPLGLTFQNFNAVAPGPGLTLTGVGFRIAGPGGTGSATVGGNPFVTNPSLTQPRRAKITYAPAFTAQATGPGTHSRPLTGPTGTVNSVPCVSQMNCPTFGGTDIPVSANRYLQLANSYSGSATIASVSGLAATAFSSGSVTVNTGSATFAGSGTNVSNGLPGTLAFSFDPDPADVEDFTIYKPYIEGTIALEYQYDRPVVPGAPVPGPLPLVGAAAAFGWSRRLKNRISSAA
jgi:hypothetical protein